MRPSIVYRLVEFSQKHPLAVILATALITVGLGIFALEIQIDPDITDLFPRQAEVMRLVEEYGEEVQHGSLVLSVESEDLFTLDKLAAFARAITSIEKLPNVLGSINPFNLVTFEREGKKLKLAPMGRDRKPPQNNDELARFQERIFKNPLTRNLIIAEDKSTLAAIFSLELLDDYSGLLTSIEKIIKDLQPHYNVRLVGRPVITETTKKLLNRDVPRILGLSILVILFVFFFSFRSRRSVILPLLVVVLGTIWTAGVMSLLGFKLTLVTLMVPPLVLTVGSSYSIHMLNQYYREAKVHSQDKQWIAGSVYHINKTILLAAFTTIIGFLSLVSANLSQVKQFGISTAIGIFFCGFLTLFFFPAMLSLLKTPKSRDRDRVLKGAISSLMERISHYVIKWKFLILALLILITVTFVYTLQFIKYQTDFIAYYKRQEKTMDDYLHAVEKFGGFVFVYVTVSSPDGQKNYFLKPDVLREISVFEERLKNDRDIAYISSFTSYLKFMNQTMTGSYEIPQRRAPILLLSRLFATMKASTSGEIFAGALVNDDFTRLTFALRIFNGDERSPLDEIGVNDFIDRLRLQIAESLAPEINPVIWGDSLAFLYISEILSRDQIVSVIVSVLLIFLITALTFRSVKYGLLALIPMVTGIMLNFILMSLFRIPFDVVTVMFSSIAIGVGIDDSIHLIIQYRRQQKIFHDDKEKIITHTLKIAGRRILLTSISLIVGLLVLVFSSFMPIAYFGLLVSLALFTTTIGALIILPAILIL